MKPLLERLRAGERVVGDGAWGTMLMARGLARGDAPERMNLEHPDVISEVAALYLEAGAEVITTNTFGASPLRLRLHGLEDRTEEICRRAVDAVRAAVGGRAYVSGSVGPTGLLLAPLGDAEPGEVSAAFARQISALATAGADAICVETMTDLAEAALAIAAARAVAPHLPVIATMTFDPTPRGYFTVMGVSVACAAAGLAEAGADVVGSNCGNGVEAMIAIASEFRRHTRLPVAIQANAGMPEERGGALVYAETPDFLAARASALLDAGVTFLGGCCGTTPGHVRALRRAVDACAASRAGGA